MNQDLAQALGLAGAVQGPNLGMAGISHQHAASAVVHGGNLTSQAVAMGPMVYNPNRDAGVAQMTQMTQMKMPFTVEKIENGWVLHHSAQKKTYMTDLTELSAIVITLMVAEKLNE